MSRTYRKWIARIAAAALLFSALSPAIAGVLFVDRPDILARILALPVQSPTDTLASICHQDGPDAVLHGQAAPWADDNRDHTAHGIYCSLCLASGSWLGVPAIAPSTAAPVSVPAVLMRSMAVQPPAAHPQATRHSRDPPQ